MNKVGGHKTEQESFWSGSFGDEYIGRNTSERLLASNIAFFSKALKSAGRIGSLVELGANVGMNLKALKALYPELDLYGVEINEKAAALLMECIGCDNVFNGSIYDFSPLKTYDVSLVKGVLIHINPEFLPLVYERLYQASAKYILICEYYSPVPVAVDYRGYSDRLFKRDFCGELLAMYPDLELLDYGFAYKRDPAFSQDDITWFLLRK